MRLSVEISDPGYHVGAYRVRVLLDGVELRRVVTADEEAGMVIRHVTGETGVLVLNEAGDGVLRETLYGQVKIELPHDFPVETIKP